MRKGTTLVTLLAIIAINVVWAWGLWPLIIGFVNKGYPDFAIALTCVPLITTALVGLISDIMPRTARQSQTLR